MGAPPHPSDGPGFAGPVRAPIKGAAIRLSGRALLIAASGAVFLFLLVMVVVRPAIERGGYGELAGVGALFLVILVAERWIRSR